MSPEKIVGVTVGPVLNVVSAWCEIGNPNGAEPTFLPFGQGRTGLFFVPFAWIKGATGKATYGEERKQWTAPSIQYRTTVVRIRTRTRLGRGWDIRIRTRRYECTGPTRYSKASGDFYKVR